MAYIRTNIYITPKQKIGLTEMAKAKDIKFSEAVRDAINRWLKEERRDSK